MGVVLPDPTPPFKGVGAPHQCPRVNKKIGHEVDEPSMLTDVEVVMPVSWTTASSSVSLVPFVRLPTEHSCSTSQQGYLQTVSIKPASILSAP